jgi:hypothetical protein
MQPCLAHTDCTQKKLTHTPQETADMSANPRKNKALVRHENLDEFLFEIARALARGLPKRVRNRIEDEIPGAKHGDIWAGRVILMVTSEFSERIEVTYIAAWTPGRHDLKVQLFSPEDIRTLAEPFKLLNEWARSSAVSERPGEPKA